MKSGIFLINKEKNYTSFDICAIVRKKMNIKKVGHTGTLDPNATGVMVVCVGEATKLVELLQEDTKVYKALFKLGISTDTLDIVGEIINDEKTKKYEIFEIENVLKQLVGHIIQTPPKYSAIKVNGKKLYEYARNNEEVIIPKREVFIEYINLLDYYHDGIYGYLEIETKVSKGTYIRTLGEQIGFLLNTYATTLELQRTMVGNIDISQTISINHVSLENLINIKNVLNYFEIKINDQDYLKVKNGVKMNFQTEEEIIQISYKNKIIALYKKDKNIYRLLKMFNSEVDF